jgi:hypothetical protein
MPTLIADGKKAGDGRENFMTDIKNWAMGILGTLLVAAIFGLVTQISASTKLQTRLDLYEKVIPAPVEQALRELRDKTNSQHESCLKTQSIAINNVTEISNLKERVAREENRP